MSSQVATVTNTFFTKTGSISLQLWDTNYSDILTFLNTPLHFSNYLVDSGAANAYVVTYPVGMTVALASGLSFQVKAGATNTGASTLNGTGITRVNGTALQAGDIISGGIFVVMYEAVAAKWLLISPASGLSWTSVAFNGAWTNQGAPYNNCEYSIDDGGIVRLRGAATNTGAGTTLIATLPSGYRPPSTCLFITYNDMDTPKIGNVAVAANGQVISDTTTTNSIFLDCVSFHV